LEGKKTKNEETKEQTKNITVFGLAGKP